MKEAEMLKGSDFFKSMQVQTVKEDHEELLNIPKKSQLEWNALSQTFLSAPSHVETNIHIESELEIARKDLVQRGAIRQEKIERRTYRNEPVLSLKHSTLLSFSKRLNETRAKIQELEIEEEKVREVVRHFKHKEYIRRKDDSYSVHILEKVFLPIWAVKQGLPQSYVTCTFLFKGVEHEGYITEKEIFPFSVSDKENFQKSVILFRDRANNTSLVGEYFTKKERANIQRVHSVPGTQSKTSVFILLALKSGFSFEKAILVLNSKKFS